VKPSLTAGAGALAAACLAGLVAARAAGWAAVPTFDPTTMPAADFFKPGKSFMTQPASFYYLHNMDKLGFAQHWSHRAGPVYPLASPSAPLRVTYVYRGKHYTLEDYYKRNYITGFLVLRDDRILSERYFYGADQDSRFLSNSNAKSVTSTLVGIALEQGKIKSLDDPVVAYLPELKQSGYARNTIRQCLLMATGIAASESVNVNGGDEGNYLDPHSSVLEWVAAGIHGHPSYTALLAQLKANPKVVPGTTFDYESVNTQVLGQIVARVTGQPFDVYLERQLWSKIGAQSDEWIWGGKTQPDICAFGCMNATLRDYARFGLMAMRGGELGGRRIVSAKWIAQATTPPKGFAPLPTGKGDVAYQGYAYQWWIPYGKDHAFEAMGIYGQLIYVNPTKHVVIVQASAWPEPDTDARWDETQRVVDTIADDVAKTK
jgi:CubicO group peptidase (beta-lactamase class C family)